MIVIVSALVGAIIGALQARRGGGNRKDMAQYAAGFGIAFALIGMLVTVILARTVA
ncbi:hypothetical protein AIOL_002039 [Candidatus Rhodobacter oscarellae]|uniref:Apolipoprotein acyltransferase n=1 Tax=Candidatus Rhodobacter oscarellae TaxID=1675527 RepID=A0A0J9E2J6_9RHOB|nr:PGF-CTERM sorting domain-containing protein [Candidatus Rhodobacter lobularis]KMW57081.1 hypothetical protein AIOL_002039 [Candidatus Rhodobacter lobularis]